MHPSAPRALHPNLAKFDTRVPAFLGTRWLSSARLSILGKVLPGGADSTGPLTTPAGGAALIPCSFGGQWPQAVGGVVRAPREPGFGGGVLYPPALCDPLALGLSSQPDHRAQFNHSQPELRCPPASPTWGSGTRNAELKPLGAWAAGVQRAPFPRLWFVPRGPAGRRLPFFSRCCSCLLSTPPCPLPPLRPTVECRRSAFHHQPPFTVEIN